MAQADSSIDAHKLISRQGGKFSLQNKWTNFNWATYPHKK